jgi:hypothetical protein
MADRSVTREVERVLVAGSWEAVSPENFRSTFLDERMARDYITETVGFRESDTMLYGILRVTYQTNRRPTANRKGWDQLNPTTRKNYAASKAFQSEAQANHMSVEEWYAVAPDLKAARRKAKGRVGKQTFNLKATESSEYPVYIARRYKGMIEDVVGLSESIRSAFERQKAQFEQYKIF